MLNYIYMKNLPVCIYVLYFIIGVGLSVLSFNIANERFSKEKIPFWIGVGMSFLCNIFIFLLVMLNMHIGFYLVVNMIVPYVSIWRSNNLV